MLYHLSHHPSSELKLKKIQGIANQKYLEKIASVLNMYRYFFYPVPIQHNCLHSIYSVLGISNLEMF
jgi:hypothetical protein